MTPLLSFWLPLMLAPVVSAEVVWASFAYMLYGERTPLRGNYSASLTSYGANQMYIQGDMFKSRYVVNGTVPASARNLTDNLPIVGLERVALDNSQVTIYSSTDDYVTGSALAFMQGLYPPVSQAVAAGDGGIATSIMANGTLINSPLGGYQYPNIQSLSILDPNSVWLEGHVACTEYGKSGNAFRVDNAADGTYNNTLAFYQRLWSTTFAGTLPMSMANFNYAYDLWDYASYHYNHNKTITAALTLEELGMLSSLADLQQFSLNGNLSASGLQQGDMIRAVAGRTLAGKVMSQLQAHIASGGRKNRLTLMFGSFEPMLAFFSLSGLSKGPSGSVFQAIPPPGSALVFELFSTGSDTTTFPNNSDLWVRFLMRNGTETRVPFREYALFGNGNWQSEVKWDDFTRGINNFAINDLSSWCNACDSINLFCEALSSNGAGSSTSTSSGGGSSGGISNVVAGVIGALVTLAFIGLVAAAGLLLNCLRRKSHDDSGRKASLGGFKGAEKMPADNDVVVTKTGARHERSGSWELGGPGGPKPADLKEETTFGASIVRHDDDNDSIMGRTPVNPRESV